MLVRLTRTIPANNYNRQFYPDGMPTTLYLETNEIVAVVVPPANHDPNVKEVTNWEYPVLVYVRGSEIPYSFTKATDITELLTRLQALPVAAAATAATPPTN